MERYEKLNFCLFKIIQCFVLRFKAEFASKPQTYTNLSPEEGQNVVYTTGKI